MRAVKKKKVYESLRMHNKFYQYMKSDMEGRKYEKWINNDNFNFFARWLLRIKSSMFILTSEIIDPLVTMDVKQFFQHKNFTSPFNSFE